jgi:hypothetical protein
MAGCALLMAPAAVEPGANITELGEAIRWSVTTMAIRGYGNRIP